MRQISEPQFTEIVVKNKSQDPGRLAKSESSRYRGLCVKDCEEKRTVVLLPLRQQHGDGKCLPAPNSNDSTAWMTTPERPTSRRRVRKQLGHRAPDFYLRNLK